MFKGPEAINAYAAWLHANKGLLWGPASVLIISTFAHIWVGISWPSKTAPPATVVRRPTPPAARRSRVSRTMPYSGS